MTTAAAALSYERAAALRDKLDSLNWLSEQLRRVREALRHSFVYTVRGHDNTELWYLIHGGCVRAIVAAPNDEESCAKRQNECNEYTHSVRGQASFRRLGD